MEKDQENIGELGDQALNGQSSTQVSSLSGDAMTVKVLHASSGEYWAEAEVTAIFNNDGSTFTCKLNRYRARANNQRKGNSYLSSNSDNSWVHEKDDCVQDGQWHEINAQNVIYSTNRRARVLFRYTYDRAGTTDPTFEVIHDFYFMPDTPIITTPSGDVGTSTFTVSGTGGMYGLGTITLHSANTISLPPITATILSNGSWQAQVTFPVGVFSLLLFAEQRYLGIPSNGSNIISVSLLVSDVTLDSPKDGDVIDTDRPTIIGKGHSDATIRIYESRSGVILYGSGNVSNGSWSIPLTEPLPNRQITLVAGQTFHGVEKWSNEVTVIVQLKPGTLLITDPPANTIVNRTFDVSGTGGAAGADIKVMLDPQDEVVGTTRAQGDSWRASVTIPANIPPGEVRLACLQTLNGIPSDRSPYRPFKLRPQRVTSLAATVDDDAKVTITGTGTVGATLYIHYVGDDAPLKTFTVPSNPWSMDYPDWLPGVAPYRIGARQSVAGSDGQPIYSDWADREGTFTVNVPLPTLTHRVSPDGIPTFSGTGRNWPGQPASTIEVRLNNTNDPIVPIVDVRPDRSWTSAAAARWAPGTYSVTARQSFKAVSSTWLQPTETVVISAPPAVIEKVTPNGLFAKVAGQCWPGAVMTITFSDNSASHPVTDTDKDGQWDFQRSTAFRPGRHTVRVTQTFGGQTSNEVSMAFEIVVSVLVITPPPGGQTDHLPVLQGTGAIDGFTIRVFDYVTHDLLGEALATGNAWSVPLKELDYLTHTVFAIQVLGDLQSVPSTSVAFNVVLFAPRIDFPKTRTSVPRTFTVEGYARAGKEFDRTEVEVDIDGVLYRVYPHFGDGYFKQHFTRTLGPCVLKARQYFKDQESPPSQDVLVTIVPDKALIETPAIGEAVEKNPVICGFGYPEDEVVVALPGGMELGRAKVHEDGTWFCLIEIPGAGTDLSLVTEQRKGEFHSGWSEPRTVQLLEAQPTFSEPPEGKWEATRAGFAGGALAGSKVDVLPWHNAEEKHANALVTNGGRWAGASERNLPAGPQWARAVQVVGGQRSIPADSKRFEIAPLDEPPHRHPAPE